MHYYTPIYHDWLQRRWQPSKKAVDGCHHIAIQVRLDEIDTRSNLRTSTVEENPLNGNIHTPATAFYAHYPCPQQRDWLARTPPVLQYCVKNNPGQTSNHYSQLHPNRP